MNIQGLTQAKFNLIDRYFLAQSDIFFAAETWHIDTDFFKHHRYHLCTSLIDTQHHSGCFRKQGGITAFSRNPQLFTILSVTEYSITLSYKNITISALYLPPKLSPQSVIQLLLSLPESQILIGDINIRYGSTFNDTVSTNTQRRLALDQFLIERSYQHTIPINGYTRTDHCFCRNIDLKWELKDKERFIHSDHYRMEIDIREDTNTPKPSSIRFNLKNLECPRKTNMLIQLCNHLLLHSEPSRTSLLSTIPTTPTEATAIVSQVYDIINHDIVQACTSVLGTYTPKFKPQHRSPTTIHEFKQYTKPANIPLLDSTESVTNHFTCHYQSLPPPHPVHFPHTNTQPHYHRFFRSKKIVTFLEQYDKSKACGADGLHSRILLHLMESNLSKAMEDLFIKCMDTGATPSQWNQSVTYPLAKTAQASTIQDFRPIALTPMFRRCFESLLLRMIQKDPLLSPYFELNFGQGGFVKSQSCPLLILTATELHHRGYNNSIYIDLKAAYDRVNLELLMADLERRHVPIFIYHLIQSLLFNCSTRVIVNQEITSTILQHTGLFQGSILAPLLWNIYIDDLATQLNGIQPNAFPLALLYADDIRILFKNSASQFDIQMYLDWISSWCHRKNMKAGINKCMYIGQHNWNIYLQDQPIPHGSNYKYLGIECDSNGINFGDFYARTEKKATNFLNSIISFKFPPMLKTGIIKSFLCPIFEYCLPLFWAAASTGRADLKLLDGIHKVIQKSVNWIFDRDCFTITMASMSGILLPEDRLLFLAASFHQQITNSPPNSVISHLLTLYPLPAANSMLCSFNRNPLVLQYRQQRPQTTFGTFLNNYKLTRLQNYGTLASYITTSGRTAGGTDRVFTIENSHLRHVAISFRLNRLYYMGSCNLCLRRFTRSCLNHPELNLTPQPSQPAHIHQLDHLLNIGNLDLFFTTLTNLCTLKD